MNSRTLPHSSVKSTALSVKAWGTRGSLPMPLTPAEIERRLDQICRDLLAAAGTRPLQKAELETWLPSFLGQRAPHLMGGYGGNTSCYEVYSAAQGLSLVIDAGTGIRALGQEWMQGACGQGQGTVHLLFTHFHWDHILGLPFFAPLYLPGNTIHIYGLDPTLSQVLTTLFQPPYFPFKAEDLPSLVVLHPIKFHQTFEIGELRITPYRLDHPDPCAGFRIVSGDKSYAHSIDTECVRYTSAELGEDIGLYQNADLLLFDAQYSAEELERHKSWGHSSASRGLHLAAREKIKKVVFMHHDPNTSDAEIARLIEDAQKTASQMALIGGSEIPAWSFGVEGQTYEV